MIADGAYLGTGLVVPPTGEGPAAPPARSGRDQEEETPNTTSDILIVFDAGYDPPHMAHLLGAQRRPAAQAGLERWAVERTGSWLAGCRRLHHRYERKAEHFLAFVGVAAVLICLICLICRRLTK
ncbi:hypothetical protein [Streptomyces sp. NPDC086989]|uniref:hypothetical protein n=1 Tax=Streptomyces sp. NPDC086989 TaxID=3365764 RepID=UPI0037FA7CE3